MAFFAIALALLLEQVRPLAEDHPAVQSLRRWLRLVGRNVDAGGLRLIYGRYRHFPLEFSRRPCRALPGALA